MKAEQSDSVSLVVDVPKLTEVELATLVIGV